jgi:hypothetical protein
MLFCVCALWETGKRTSAGIPKGLRSLCSFALEVCIRKEKRNEKRKKNSPLLSNCHSSEG